MRDFQVLFDHGERSALLEPEMARYGKLGFPAPPGGRPWIFSNFAVTMDGLVSLLGDESSGGDIARLPEDRWLMDLLRAHADAVMLGMGTLREETRLGRPRPRGPIFRVVDPAMQQLRTRLRRGRERNILVSARGDFQMSDYAVFDAEAVDVTILTTHAGAERLSSQAGRNPKVDILAVESADSLGGDSKAEGVDLALAMSLLRVRYGIEYLLCEGGPTLYSQLLLAGLMDEKFVTVAPIEAGQSVPEGLRPTILPHVGLRRDQAIRWRWMSCRKLEDYQFHRYRRLDDGIC
jgi:riboflavin biosynthesis pyrimidine reductase